MSVPAVISLDTYEDWSSAAETAVYQLLDEGRTVSADDIHAMVDDSVLTPQQRSAWPGALFRRLARDGVITKADYGASCIRSRRGGARYEWKGIGR